MLQLFDCTWHTLAKYPEENNDDGERRFENIPHLIQSVNPKEYIATKLSI